MTTTEIVTHDIPRFRATINVCEELLEFVPFPTLSAFESLKYRILDARFHILFFLG